MIDTNIKKGNLIKLQNIYGRWLGLVLNGPYLSKKLSYEVDVLWDGGTIGKCQPMTVHGSYELTVEVESNED